MLSLEELSAFVVDHQVLLILFELLPLLRHVLVVINRFVFVRLVFAQEFFANRLFRRVRHIPLSVLFQKVFFGLLSFVGVYVFHVFVAEVSVRQLFLAANHRQLLVSVSFGCSDYFLLDSSRIKPVDGNRVLFLLLFLRDLTGLKILVVELVFVLFLLLSEKQL